MNDRQTLGIKRKIDRLFETTYHLTHVDTIFRRVFGE